METANTGINDFLGDLLAKQPKREKKKAAKPATSAITKSTRRESHEKTDKQPMKQRVLEVLGNRELTAREVAEEMFKRGFIPYPARAVVQPRITELVAAEKIEAAGWKMDEETQRKVAVYKRINSHVL